MDAAKQWIAATVLAAVVLVAAGWFLLISPERGEATALREQATATELTNEQLAAQLAVLRQKAEGLPAEQAQLAEAATKIPSEAGLPTLLRSLTAAARSAGVELVTVTPGSAVPVQPPAAPAAPVPPADPAAAADPAAPAEAAPAETAAAPTAAAAAVSAIPLTISVVGDFYEIEQFLAEIEDLPRALRVTALSVAPGTSPADGDVTPNLAESGRSLSATITGQVFVASAAATSAPAIAAPVPAAADAASTAPAS